MQALSNEELRALLEAARGKRERDWLMILVAYWHGLRASEVVGLTVDSVAGGFITVQRLKGSLKTVQPLMEHSDPLFDEKKSVIEFTRGMHGNQRVFPVTRVRFWQIMQECGRAAALPEHRRHPHVLKHTIAMRAIEAGIEHARQWLGHKSMSSTGEYLRVSDDQAALAVAKAGGGRV